VSTVEWVLAADPGAVARPGRVASPVVDLPQVEDPRQVVGLPRMVGLRQADLPQKLRVNERSKKRHAALHPRVMSRATVLCDR
jgi:hypothetical protein